MYYFAIKGSIIVAKDKRFERVYSQGMGTMEIWVDKETGVNYIYRQSGYSGGLTVLIDANGKPVVTPITEEEN
jgi:hypothetical protein